MSRKLPDSMHWQIYQAYLQGPHALFRLFEDAFGRLALHGQPEPDHAAAGDRGPVRRHHSAQGAGREAAGGGQ